MFKIFVGIACATMFCRIRFRSAFKRLLSCYHMEFPIKSIILFMSPTNRECLIMKWNCENLAFKLTINWTNMSNNFKIIFRLHRSIDRFNLFTSTEYYFRHFLSIICVTLLVFSIRNLALIQCYICCRIVAAPLHKFSQFVVFFSSKIFHPILFS